MTNGMDKDGKKTPEYDLESILAEFGSPHQGREDLSEQMNRHSQRLVMKSMDDAFRAETQPSAPNDAVPSDAPAQDDVRIYTPKRGGAQPKSAPRPAVQSASPEPPDGQSPPASPQPEPQPEPQPTPAKTTGVPRLARKPASEKPPQPPPEAVSPKTPTAPEPDPAEEPFTPHRRKKARLTFGEPEPWPEPLRDTVPKPPPEPQAAAPGGQAWPGSALLDRLRAGARRFTEPGQARPETGKTGGPEEAGVLGETQETGGPGGAEPELDVREVADNRPEAQYASAEAGTEPPEGTGENAPSLGQRILAPIMSLLALAALQAERRNKGDDHKPTVAAEDLNVPELEPDKAVRFYAVQGQSLRLRSRIAGFLCLIMLYLSFAYYSNWLPLAGALGSGVRVISLLLLILEMSVIITGLDLFVGGLLAIPRWSMGAETLIAVSCVASMADAVVIAAVNKPDYGIPFCAVSALSMFFALRGAYHTCRGTRLGMRILTAVRELSIVSAQKNAIPNGTALLKYHGSPAGFLRHSEESDAGETVYGYLTPFLMAASLVLGLVGSVAHGQPGAVMHCIAVLLSTSANFSCALCFALPFSAVTGRLYQNGAAIAGWSGCRELGKSQKIILTDADVFPKGTVRVGNIRILEGAFTDQVIGYTASIFAASENGLAQPFDDVLRRNGYSTYKVENFMPHNRGMSAVVNGERVYVGSKAFMKLMGIHLPGKLPAETLVFTAIGDRLVGLFEIIYQPSSSVQDALVTLLHSRVEAIFALRDFNVTPDLIQDRFRLPTTGSFKFPSYEECFRISAIAPEQDSQMAAVVVRGGMGPLVDLAERGRRAYLGIQAAAAVAAVGSLFGLIMMFLLCWTGSFDSATASNVITFMLLWLIPVLLIVVWQRR